ncbi:MAG: hypothetical protein GY760_14010 [Deltaproteobacteria bacterium]|nr:hypothetical protein [Deltaproteobacteria bacterium]
MRKGDLKYFDDQIVHWVFVCGCEYRGKKYLLKYKIVCLTHFKELKGYKKICKTCGKSFEVGIKMGSTRHCDDCRIKGVKGKFDGVCSRPDCNNPKPEENHFLCNSCKKSYGAEVIYG